MGVQHIDAHSIHLADLQVHILCHRGTGLLDTAGDTGFHALILDSNKNGCGGQQHKKHGSKKTVSQDFLNTLRW